jgi:L-ascorbate metabolism protein UlaG (beta-lactamase superfamily)
MHTDITWLGHATWIVATPAGRLLVDPFLDENPKAPMRAADVDCDAILLTHGHFDHVADCVAIAKRTKAPVIANFEITQWLGKHGVANCQPMNHGGRVKIPGGTAKMELAFHSSTLPDGSSGGNPGSFVLDLGGTRIFIAGDTGVFSDMERIGRAGLAAAIVPIGDVFTMGPEDAVEAVRLLRPKIALPSHYGTWPPIEQDAVAWAASINAEKLADARVLAPGETTRVG